MSRMPSSPATSKSWRRNLSELSPLLIRAVPVHEKFDLEVLDLVGLQDPLHFCKADLLLRGHRIFIVKAEAFEAGPRGRLYPILEREGTDFHWSERVNIARKREIRDQKFDVVNHGHTFS